MARARQAVESVLDPELPVVTLAELGVIRGVELNGDRVEVALTPTYTGCPALAQMRADIQAALARAGFPRCEITTVLAPAWTTDWISESGRRKLADHAITPPGPAPRHQGPVPLTLAPRPPETCPRCGSGGTVELSRFSGTACRSLHSCTACGEPFEHMKAI
ncbi:1,2-phenylacetyl-CoA epoxidase subunit PaaD [Actinomadura macrotermitis]|uniref:1,2-phenylacetyl-CoA epoxidase subunit PaaD n=1 Tax=Actinomadura macrotermitis TaxID=2585200 RepID=UPI002E2615C6